MSGLFARARRFPKLHARHVSTAASSEHVFKEGDRILIQKRSGVQRISLSQPLKAGRKINVLNGWIEHASIIGRRPRDTVFSTADSPYRLLVPSLEEYVTLTPRRVTPIYPNDNSVIVSQLDLHLSPQSPPQGSTGESDSDPEQFEILEAGTGHGALTLYLSRALHGANMPPPAVTREAEEAGKQVEGTEKQGAEAPMPNPDVANLRAQSGPLGLPAPYPAEWRRSRQAVLHTLDISPENSLHARKIVRGFRRGLYAGNVDFYIGDVKSWVANEKEKRFGEVSVRQEQTFLNHAILDFPSCFEALGDVSSALHSDGKLLVWNPSVTQIVDCVEKIRAERLPLILEKVLELGPSLSGGREWDIRIFNRKVSSRSSAEPESVSAENGIEQISETLLPDSVSPVDAEPEKEAATKDGKTASPDTNPVLICHPAVGIRTTNVGFLGVWSKMRYE